MFKDCGALSVGLVWVPSYRTKTFLAHITKV